MSTSFGKPRLPKVFPTARSDVLAAVLTASHVRMLLSMAAVTITLWYTFSTLHMKCDFEDTNVLDKMTEFQVFSNDPTEQNGVSSIHWLECLNSTNKYKTKIPFTATPAFVQAEWRDKIAYKCIREDAAIGRDTVHVAIIVIASLIAAGMVAQVFMLWGVKEHTNHPTTGIAMSIFHGLTHIAVIGSLWYVQDAAFYAAEDDEKREIPRATWWIWAIAIISAVGAAIDAISYGILTLQRFYLATDSKGDKPAEKSQLNNFSLMQGSQIELPEGQFKYRYARTDHVLAQHSHECLTRTVLLTVVCILAFTALRVHEEKPGVHKFEIIEGDMIDDLTTGDLTDLNGAGLVDRVALFDANCTPGTPFRMNVSMYHQVISTKHHIKHHIKSEQDGLISLMSIFSVLLGAEVVVTGMIYYRQTQKLSQAYDPVSDQYSPVKKAAEPAITDLFFTWIPLAAQLINAIGSMLALVLVGFGITQGHDNLSDYILGAAVFCTLSFLLHLVNLALWYSHKFNHPKPKPKEERP